MSLFDMTGKVAVITGSTRGIGRAIAEEMATQGARVVISSRKQDACDAVAAEINERFGAGTATAIAASISSKDALETLVSRTQAEVGPIDVLVCNAASNPYYGPMSGIADEQFRKIMDNNVLSNHWLIQLCLPGMIARRDGAVIVVSSIGGLRGSSTIGAYCISKAADMQLVRNLAVEVGQHNIRANAIAPGLIRTDFARALWDNPEAEKAYNSGHPMRRIGMPEEIAGAAVFLASKAGSYVNGQTIVVDGGSTV
ncbi:SDR family NAD(P)-dependent oxidoreductase [Novosphingobium olei]|uniref:SDR family oxidoreductase n=1 Tax=Novosphingobium olei TaxID=2728851 RepID=A0A7Y0GAM6_9SPHN|nr:SDR family oxidoreductase [Novosphingobium olei]NML94253.1 SDR family oxidoreductase [Novosphingobium olei]